MAIISTSTCTLLFFSSNGNRYSGVEASKSLALSNVAPAHDTISRWLAEETSEPNDLWKHVRSFVSLSSSLIVDDTVLDKQWSPKNELVNWHWSGNTHKGHSGYFSGQSARHAGERLLSGRLPRKRRGEEREKKNEYFLGDARYGKRARFQAIRATYSPIRGTELARKCEAHPCARLEIRHQHQRESFGERNKRSLHGRQHFGLDEKQVRKVWLKGFGFVLVTRIVFKNGDTRYVCTNGLALTAYTSLSQESKQRWTIRRIPSRHQTNDWH